MFGALPKPATPAPHSVDLSSRSRSASVASARSERAGACELSPEPLEITTHLIGRPTLIPSSRRRRCSPSRPDKNRWDAIRKDIRELEGEAEVDGLPRVDNTGCSGPCRLGRTSSALFSLLALDRLYPC